MPKGSRRGAKQAERELLETNGRPLPPDPREQEAEDPTQRPCQCEVCVQVPVANGQPDVEAVSETCFLGVYPRGLSSIALDELQREHCSVLAHEEEHCALLFRPQDHVLELGSFLLLCEVLGDPEFGPTTVLPPSPSLQDLAHAAEMQARASCKALRRAMRPFKTWRVSVYRSGATQRWRSPEVAIKIGEAIAPAGSIALSPSCTAGPQVDLKSFEVEVVAFVSDGVDELQVAAGAKRSELMGNSELLLLGLRSGGCRARQVTLGIQKGDLLSRADDTAALCVAQKALEFFRGDSCLRVLDPMCGVGTYLFALQWALSRMAPKTVAMWGADAEAESLMHATGNAKLAKLRTGSRIDFFQGSNGSLPLKSDFFELIVVDPPWGQRHSSHAYVKHHLYAWAREWARLLRPGGVAVVAHSDNGCQV